MTYKYEDDFIVSSIDPLVHSTEETKAIAEVDLMEVTTEPFREKLVVYLVYMELCLMQLENEGMQEKYDAYSKKYDRALNVALRDSPSSVSTIPLGRG